MSNSKKNKAPFHLGSFLIRLAIALLCLLILSIYLMSGLFARYVSKGEGGDFARVAGFDVSVYSVTDDVNIEYGVSPNSEGAYTISVANDSEVVVTYDIKVVVDKADASFDIRVALEGTELDTKTTSELLFENVGYLSPDEQETHDLVFSVLDWGDFTKNQTGAASRTETLAFRVYVDVVQVD